MDYIKIVEQAFSQNKAASYPDFKAGDTITVTYRIKEGDKERLQKFRGTVIQLRGASAATRTFTVRKVASGVGVERIFPMESPFIE
ncbi:MAG: 50S ribosomal protein L19, partial [Bacteroidales bacterium]|nr:50S ribosomal protein L19 [Bacteroidales bacterium]